MKFSKLTRPELEEILKNAVVIQENTGRKDIVRVGSVVEVEVNGKTKIFTKPIQKIDIIIAHLKYVTSISDDGFLECRNCYYKDISLKINFVNRRIYFVIIIIMKIKNILGK